MKIINRIANLQNSSDAMKYLKNTSWLLGENAFD